jgi:hypothetical protein
MIVECHAGYAYPQEPRAVVLQGTRLEVERLCAEWRTADARKHFQVLLRGGMPLELVYDENRDAWEDPEKLPDQE